MISNVESELLRNLCYRVCEIYTENMFFLESTSFLVVMPFRYQSSSCHVPSSSEIHHLVCTVGHYQNCEQNPVPYSVIW